MKLSRILAVALLGSTFALACSTAAPSETASANAFATKRVPSVCQAQELHTCISCCIDGNMDGAIADDNAWNAASDLYEQCVCHGTSKCQDVCGASYCGGKDADDACNSCLDGETACAGRASAAYDEACLADAACTALHHCVDGCPPAPPNDDGSLPVRFPASRQSRRSSS